MFCSSCPVWGQPLRRLSKVGKQVVERLAHGGVGEDLALDVAGGHAVVDGHLEEVDDFVRFGAQQGDAQNFTRAGIGHGLEQAVGLAQDLGFRNGLGLERGDFDVAARLARGSFRHANVRQRRLDEDGRGKRRAVCRAALALAKKLIAHDAPVIQRDVGELRAARHVAHGPDVRDGILKSSPLR